MDGWMDGSIDRSRATYIATLAFYVHCALTFRFCGAGIGLTTGDQGRVWLAPNKPTVAVFANQSYFVSCKAPGAEKIAWIKVGEGEITPSSGK